MPDIESLLRRYRPVGPPSGLQARIFGEECLARTWPWAAAAAALLAMTIVVQAAIYGIVAREAPVAEIGPTVEELVDLLGGGEEARRTAELILLEQQTRAAISLLNPVTPAPEGSGVSQ